MYELKVEFTKEIAWWLQRLRVQSRMSLPEVARITGTEEVLLIGWETGFPIPVADFLVLMRVYGVGGELIAAKFASLVER